MSDVLGVLGVSASSTAAVSWAAPVAAGMCRRSPPPMCHRLRDGLLVIV